MATLIAMHVGPILPYFAGGLELGQLAKRYVHIVHTAGYPNSEFWYS
jgi:hypothetical protein